MKTGQPYFLALLVTILLSALFVAPKVEPVSALAPPAILSTTARYIQLFDKDGSESSQFITSEPITLSISGQVSDGNATPIEGVTISATGGHSAITDNSGHYTISGLANDDYTPTPTKENYIFEPTSRTVSGADVTALDFVGTMDPYPAPGTATATPTPTNSPTLIPAVASVPFYDSFETSALSRGLSSNREPDALGAGWSARFTSQGAIRISTEAAYGGTYGVLLEDQIRDEIPSTAALVLTIDLAGHSDVELEFWWREFNDENHATDGVFISDNWGATWHKVHSFNNGASEFRQEQIHLDPYVTANGLTFNDHFQIKFQFYDNHPYPNDGYAIDDVRVQSDVKSNPVTATPTPIITDAYENNDSCEEAGTLATDGTLQEHTFHDAADEDWLKIQVTEGITIVIEARVPPTSNADVLLEVYSSCAGNVPVQNQDPNFSEDVRLILRPPASGTYYLRLLDHDPTVFGDDYAYTLSVREVPTGAAPGALIVVAGRLRENDRVQPNIHHVTNAVYQFARQHDCAPSDILYLAPDMSLDGDGDGVPDVDAQVSKAQLQQAITEWAPDHVGPDEPLTIYLMDHGGEERFYLDGANGEWVTPAELDSWLTQLESSIPGLESQIIYEACLSGSFISQPQSISGARRLVMTSTGQWSLAYASQEGAIFSDTFIDALAQGMNLQAAFQEGALTANSVHPDQSAWLDDNGDGVYTSADGQIAAQRAFACTAPPLEQLWAPYIAQASITKVTEGQAEISAEVRDDKQDITQVRAVIYSPSYTQPDSSEEIIPEQPPVILQAQGNGQYSVMSDQFTEAGTYRVHIYAEDGDGLTSRPQEVIVEVSQEFELYLPITMR